MKFVPSLFAVSLAAMGALAAPVEERGPPAHALSKQLYNRLTIKGLTRHTDKFQSFADANGGNRVFGSKGHNETIQYFVDQTKPYYDVTVQPATFNYTETVKETVEFADPSASSSQDDIKVKLMTYSSSTPEEGVTGEVAVIPNNGCKAEDYGEDVKGKIALVIRGECAFGDKATLAGKAGAVGVLVYNNEEGDVNGTLGGPVEGAAPAGGISKEHGELLKKLASEGKVTLKLTLIEFHEERSTANVCAQTKSGNKNNVIVVGAHSDSVVAGPGINDNGSGSAALLEVAHLFRNVKPANAVRFCWWTAEEFGLLGAEHYVKNLSEEEKNNIALYLNFDMVASPNAINGVYSPSASAEGVEAPAGSNAIEKIFVDFFKEHHGYSTPSEFNGRSDYGPFIEAGIPSGGTFTGAEGIMTEEEAKQYGGQAGVAYDENYHAAGDTVDNLNHDFFLLHARAIGHAVATYSDSTADVDAEKGNSTNTKPIKSTLARPASAQVKPVYTACGSHAVYDM
ncbi:leucine aminopeptidase 1 [Lichtheimia corymbifera JMRC:FSU:9682]|uniref:Peptide hydrolase n=1 Tax=Lichtheimia corymbifera JMRC:FSU:9682 TaxID=1263082 RepID=A0A068RNU8_9FUNG|nr:leucine aminopeptidase 1 [Lichtheimia corymbifera JMRC:FSU:9682]